MSDKYILDAHGEPVQCHSLSKWANWFESSRDKRRVAQDMIGDVKVSTVFLGLDHAFDGGDPVLWETMVFGGPLNEERDRCTGSREQAEAMHARMVARVEGARP